MQPQIIFETSWEVCNRVGGIYTVLSTRAASMQSEHPDSIYFFGPDLGKQSDKYFTEDANLLSTWESPLSVRVGRWNIPGTPIAILLHWDHLWAKKDEIYSEMWQQFGVQSHAAMGDYDDSCLFSYAAGQVIESLYHYLHAEKKEVCMHANEWQTAFALFYIRTHCPQIATLFTTHATGIGRSIASNGKPLYDYFGGYHGNQMASELGMVSKHSVERQAAHAADCFTTVSDITARECAQLLDRPVDIVTPNGFEPDFVPKGETFTRRRNTARAALLKAADTLLPAAYKSAAEPMLIGIAGRLEWKNKGIDAFLDAMNVLGSLSTSRPITAFVMIPYLNKQCYMTGNVRVIFVPYYLDEHDPLIGKTYYDLLIGLDATVFPSYYEPWGYTPLESVAFGVPTVTTSLAGFGVWAKGHIKNESLQLLNGIAVIRRTDSNYEEVVHTIAHLLAGFSRSTDKEQAAARKAAIELSHKAEWRYFFQYYRHAYDIALQTMQNRTNMK